MLQQGANGIWRVGSICRALFSDPNLWFEKTVAEMDDRQEGDTVDDM